MAGGTRSMTDFAQIIDNKFDEFKKSILVELKLEMDNYFQKERINFENFIASKREEVIKLSKNDELLESVEAIKKHVNSLNDENTAIKEANKILTNELEDLQQYVRRPNLRIFGVKVEKNESSKDVETKVKRMISDANIEIPDEALDRAHRIERTKEDQDGNVTQPIIVRFSSFRDRTIVYKARKDIKNKFHCGVSLDLTKSRLQILNRAREIVEDVDGINFVYSDINCNLRAFTKNGEHLKFNNICDLEIIIANME